MTAKELLLSSGTKTAGVKDQRAAICFVFSDALDNAREGSEGKDVTRPTHCPSLLLDQPVQRTRRFGEKAEVKNNRKRVASGADYPVRVRALRFSESQ